MLLEPVMRVSVSAPGSAVGDVLGDLQRRGGQIVNLTDRQERTEIEADVPLAQLDGYSTALRSLSQGRASAVCDGLSTSIARSPEWVERH